MATKAAFFRSVLICASARAAARARLPKSKTSLLRSSIAKQNLWLESLHFRRSSEPASGFSARNKKHCSNSLARRNTWEDSGAPAIRDHCGNSGCGRKFYGIEFRDHAAHRDRAFFAANETIRVGDIGDYRNPFAGMIYQSVNTCKHNEQYGFHQYRNLGKATMVVPEA